MTFERNKAIRNAFVGACGLVGLVVVPMLVGLGGCTAIGGVETRTLDPLSPDCVLEESGTARIRFANLVTSDDAFDVCVAASGGQYTRSLLRGKSLACAQGIPYSTVTRAFQAPAGSVDVKVIPGGQSCKAAAVAEMKGVPTSSDVPTTLALMGEGNGSRELLAIRETTSDAASTKLRFVNTVPGSPGYYLGAPARERLPTTIANRYANDLIAYRGILPPAAQLPIAFAYDNGYVVFRTRDFLIGLGEGASTAATVAYDLSRISGNASLYITGSLTNGKYPVRGLVCNEIAENGNFAACTATSLPGLTVDVYSTSLAGLQRAYETDRRSAILDAIASRSGNFLCLTETFRAEDKEAIIAAAKKNYPYAYVAKADLDTVPDDPKDANGVVPVNGGPPCSDPMDVDGSLNAIKCISDNCQAPDGTTSSQSCLVQKCAQVQVAFKTKKCLACDLWLTASNAQLSTIHERCTTDARLPRMFEGAAGVVLLSRHPLSKQETYFLPSTGYRQAFVHAQAELEDKAIVDVLCGSVSPFNVNVYAGDYGGDATDDLGRFQNEQKLQATKLVTWIKDRTENRPSIIAGQWYASVAAQKDGKPLVGDFNPAVLGTLSAAFTEAVPASYTPSCTYCMKDVNALNALATAPLWTSRVFLANWAAESDAARVLFTEPTVTLPDGSKVPASMDFAYSVDVVRPALANP